MCSECSQVSNFSYPGHGAGRKAAEAADLPKVGNAGRHGGSAAAAARRLDLGDAMYTSSLLSWDAIDSNDA